MTKYFEKTALIIAAGLMALLPLTSAPAKAQDLLDVVEGAVVGGVVGGLVDGKRGARTGATVGAVGGLIVGAERDYYYGY